MVPFGAIPVIPQASAWRDFYYLISVPCLVSVCVDARRQTKLFSLGDIIMKYLLYACFLATAALHSVSSWAGPAPAFKAAKATTTLLTDMTDTGQHLVAVGKHGTIIYSSDAVNWQQAEVPLQTLLTSVYFADSEYGWACGHDGAIIHSRDGGANWEIQQYLPQLDKPCLDIYFADRQNGIAIGAYGMYFKTVDGGQSWHKQFLDSLLFEEDREYLAGLKVEDPEGYEIETSAILPHFNRILAQGNTLFIVGEMGLLAQSEDGGANWVRLEEIYPGSFFDLKPYGNGGLIVAGLRGNIFTRAPGEEAWQQVYNDITATINAVVIKGDEAIMLGNSGVIYHYRDGVLSHEQLKDGKAILSGVIFGSRLVMATENGIKVKELEQ